MFMSDKKKPVTLIIDKLGERPAPMVDGAEQDLEPGLDTAAEEVLAAVEAKDAKALKAALRSMVQMCMDEYEASESEDYEASEPKE